MPTRSFINYHVLIELALCSVIAYMFFNKPETLTNVNASALSTSALSDAALSAANTASPSKGAFLNFAILDDKSIALLDRNGKNLTDKNNKPIIAPNDRSLHTIAVMIEDGKGDSDTHLSESLLNLVVPPAQAAHLYKIRITSDAQTTCYWYDDYHFC